MDYERKYIEALAWIRSLYPTMKGAIREDAEHYFSELKKSDDKKISKDLIWCLTHCGLKPDEPINPHVNTITKDAIAWLKKHGKKHTWSEEDEKAINDIMWIIAAYRKNGFNETHIRMADNSENWLKELEERLK